MKKSTPYMWVSSLLALIWQSENHYMKYMGGKDVNVSKWVAAQFFTDLVGCM